MYRVLIADDEPSVLESLQESIEWHSLGFEVAACASGGREVLELLKQEKIDVAILDIRMPGMSGLELCEHLKKAYEDMQIIFISGYAEFSYAQKAISYGALGYCLKPLEYDQITKLLLKAAKQLEKGALPASGAELLDALENNSRWEIAEVLARLGCRRDMYHVLVSVGDRELSFSKEEGITVEFGRGQYGYLIYEAFSEEKLQHYAGNEKIRGIGYEKRAVNAAELKDTLDECIVRAYQFFIEPEQKICSGSDGKRAGELLGQITRNIEKNRWEEVCDQLLLIQEKYCRYFDVRSAMRLANMIYTGNLFREETNDYYIYSRKQLVSEYGTFPAMLDGLCTAVLETIHSQGRQEPFSNTAFMKLMRYIGENYKNEISLTSAGEALHMNPNYVSQLFKKETGITFVHYITQLRIEDATRLLTTTTKPVTEIAMEVGFNDYFYFLKTFKKLMGKTPGQYREEN